MIDASRLRVSEAVGLAYFGYLSLTALVVPLPPLRRLRVWSASAFVLAAAAVLVRQPPFQVVGWLRDWYPAFVILLAYFVTGAFFVTPSPRVEQWLRRSDERLIGDRRFDELGPAWRLYLDIVYDACFLMIPGGFAVLVWIGQSSRADEYWTLVSLAEFLAFGTLPWLQARPPWAVESRRQADRSAVRRFSLFWVNHTSIRANTFPSGHASASLAVALALWPVTPAAAAVFGVLAISIAVGSVVGRFHYAIDAITGILLALAIWACVALIRG